MYVHVNGSRITLEEPEDLARFHVLCATGTSDLAGTLSSGGWGRLDESGEALIAVDALRTAAAGRVGPGWDEEFAAMMAYATTKGWVTEDGGHLRAHVEVAGPG